MAKRGYKSEKTWMRAKLNDAIINLGHFPTEPAYGMDDLDWRESAELERHYNKAQMAIDRAREHMEDEDIHSFSSALFEANWEAAFFTAQLRYLFT